MLRKYKLLVIGLIGLIPAIAQVPCGTLLTNEQIQYELNKKKSLTVAYPDRINKTIEITAFILSSDSAGRMRDIPLVVDSLNTAFANIGLQFKVCKYEYVKNSSYFMMDPKKEAEVRVKYFNPNTINIYFVDSIINAAGTSVDGYAYYPASKLDVMVIKGFKKGTIIHEMGHFFGLYHTHELKFGVENANGSNCATAGDLICDTPAEPDLSGKVNDKCEYNGIAKDSKGNFFAPMVGNFMNYANELCKCFFTNMQYRKMVENYYVFKTHLR